MSYRGPQTGRARVQVDQAIIQHAGQGMVWRQFVSASSGATLAGFGPTRYYRESTITGIMGRAPMLFIVPEGQTPAGAMAQGRFLVTTREKLGREDELVWQGDVYRVESEPTPARLSNMWTVEVKRGDT